MIAMRKLLRAITITIKKNLEMRYLSDKAEGNQKSRDDQSHYVGTTHFVTEDIGMIHDGILTKDFAKHLTKGMKHKYDNYSTKNRLAEEIGVLYHDYKFATELTEDQVREIQKDLTERIYILSPLKISLYDRREDLPDERQHTYLVKYMDNIHYGVIEVRIEDLLVLTALGRMLNHNLINIHFFSDNSYGLRIKSLDFRSILSSQKDVLSLYIIDFTSSLKTIREKSLLWRLSFIVKDMGIIDLVDQFLTLPILDEKGINYKNIMGWTISSAGLITYVLQNFALYELDVEFARVFPEVGYHRYVHEAFITFPRSMECMGEDFPGELLSFLKQFNFESKIKLIRPGEEAVVCHDGIISVTLDGNIRTIDNITPP